MKLKIIKYYNVGKEYQMPAYVIKKKGLFGWKLIHDKDVSFSRHEAALTYALLYAANKNKTAKISHGSVNETGIYDDLS